MSTAKEMKILANSFNKPSQALENTYKVIEDFASQGLYEVNVYSIYKDPNVGNLTTRDIKILKKEGYLVSRIESNDDGTIGYHISW